MIKRKKNDENWAQQTQKMQSRSSWMTTKACKKWQLLVNASFKNHFQITTMYLGSISVQSYEYTGSSYVVHHWVSLDENIKDVMKHG